MMSAIKTDLFFVFLLGEKYFPFSSADAWLWIICTNCVWLPVLYVKLLAVLVQTVKFWVWKKSANAFQERFLKLWKTNVTLFHCWNSVGFPWDFPKYLVSVMFWEHGMTLQETNVRSKELGYPFLYLNCVHPTSGKKSFPFYKYGNQLFLHQGQTWRFLSLIYC